MGLSQRQNKQGEVDERELKRNKLSPRVLTPNGPPQLLGLSILSGHLIQDPATTLKNSSPPSSYSLPLGPSRNHLASPRVCLCPFHRTNKHEELNATQQLQLTDPNSWNLPIKSWHWGGRGKPGSGRGVLTSCIEGPTGHSARASLGQSDKRRPRQASQSIRAAGGI